MVAFVAMLGAAISPSNAERPTSSAACVKLSGLVSTAAFRRYAVHPAAQAVWRGVDVRKGQAHLFRTALRSQAVGLPNFAGHYTVARLGCGSGTVCPAFIDRANGHVLFLPAMKSVFALEGNETPATGYDRLAYRRDSQLLVLLGAGNEDMRTSGVSLYRWNEGKPSLIRFVPEPSLCRTGWDYQ